MIRGHGDDAYRYKNIIRADFSSNVCYGPLDSGLLAHLQNSIASVTHYPDAGAEGLQHVIAHRYGLEDEQVLVTNGATEAIYLIAQAYRGQEVVIFTPAFAEYEDACRLHGLDVQLWLWDGLLTVPSIPARLAFLCNPNNPTGAALPQETIRQLLQSNPHCTFVIDESYIDFTLSTSSLLPELSVYPNAILLRSLTKNCRIPGLRIGWAIGTPALISAIRRGKMPWSVNQLAMEAALYIFQHPDQFTIPLSRLLQHTADWQKELQQVTGWQGLPSSTHYFLLDTGGNYRVDQLKRWLIEWHGLLIRDASNFHGLTPGHFRLACQEPAQNQLLTEALKECIHTGLS